MNMISKRKALHQARFLLQVIKESTADKGAFKRIPFRARVWVRLFQLSDGYTLGVLTRNIEMLDTIDCVPMDLIKAKIRELDGLLDQEENRTEEAVDLFNGLRGLIVWTDSAEYRQMEQDYMEDLR